MGVRTRKKQGPKANVNYGNRGMVFESHIELSNRMYEAQGSAVINKRPTPVKVLQQYGGYITKAVFEKPSTVDYDGIYRGRRIDFEAKDVTDFVRLDLSRIEDHQYQHLENSHKHGSMAFILVRFGRNQKMYLLPFVALRVFKQASELPGGRKSISIDDFEIEGYEIRNGRVPVDYLAAVDKIWFPVKA
ncbi:Holliday junction resolvase RecU [Paenibacillus graminis]|uniref:Holliday junction resolvase RecU n=1 Tax=Paenibacillus graminis TaxID=189425 RepID=UPI002DBD9A1D|nr:Holliday junction resolvase RecU [Paenibacillus graminis]MEC0173027.1 Holliday junction resolvase RecU [Paenibacillus graminis]